MVGIALPKVQVDLLDQVLSFVFDHQSFIRDETLPEKILRVFEIINDRRLKELLDPLESNLQRCFKVFTLYSQAIQSLALRLVSVVLRVSSSTLFFFRVLQYDNLSTASKSAYVKVCASSVACLSQDDILWIPIKSVIRDVLTANVYLSREIGKFFSVARQYNSVLFSLLLEHSGKESIVFWNRLLCCSPLDLTEAKLQQVVVKIRSTGHVDPKLIVKHPELLPAIPFELVSCNCGSPAYFEVLSMYAIHFRGSRDSDILDRFLVHLNLDPENEDLTLKSQFVDPFCSVINGLEETSTSWPLIHPLFKCLVERKVEPLSLRLRTLRCLCDKFEQEVSNVVLLDIFETAMTESDAKSLQFIVDFFFQLNHHRLDEMWTSVYEVRVSNNPFSRTNQLVSMKILFKQAVDSTNWDIRDAICCSVGSSLVKHRLLKEPDLEIFKDVEEMVSKFMNDPNHYVLCSVLKLLPSLYKDESSIVDLVKFSAFFEHCSNFCEDSVHAELVNLFKHFPQFAKFSNDESLLRRTFESDLCSYRTKGRAAKLIVENRKNSSDESELPSFPEWLSKLLMDEFSDQQLVEEVNIAVGLKQRPHLSDDMYAELQLMAVCKDIMAESITSNVPLDCY